MKSIRIILSLIMLFSLTPKLPAESIEPLSVESLALPKTLGKVSYKFKGTGNRWIIQIQDIHAHLTAQENISAIVERLHEAYGIDTIALEGGWSKTHFTEDPPTPSSQPKQMLARALMEEDYITGPVNASLFAQTPLHLVGVEDPEVYENTRQLYVKHFSQRDELLKKVREFQEKIIHQKQIIYNPELALFDSHLTAFRIGKKADQFIPALIERSEKLGVDLTEMTQIKTFKKILALEKSLDKEKLQSQANRLYEQYKNTGMKFEELLASGKVPDKQLARYPMVKTYKKIMALEDSIQHFEFFKEIETAIERFKLKLFISEEEQTLDKTWESVLAASKVILFEAAPDDLTRFKSLKTFCEPLVSEFELVDALQTGLDFYAKAHERDEIFFNALQENPDLAGNVAIVAGGFHTEGLSALLEKAGISYVVLTPDLGENIEINHALYKERLLEEVPQTQTFSELRNRPLTSRFRRAFQAGEQSLALERNITKALTIVKTYQEASPSSQADQEQAMAQAKKEVIPFTSLSPDEQKAIVADYVAMQNTTEQSTIVNIIIKRSVLRELLQDKTALAAWEQAIKGNKKNKVFLIKDDADVLIEAVGGNIRPASGEISDLLAREKDKAENLGGKFLAAVIDPAFNQADMALILKPSAPALILARPLLEKRDSRFDPQDEEAIKTFASLLSEFYASQNLLDASA